VRIRLETAAGETIHEFEPQELRPGAWTIRDVLIWRDRHFVLFHREGAAWAVYREATVYVVPEPACRLVSPATPLRDERPSLRGELDGPPRRFGDNLEPPRFRHRPPARREYE
jgi:hypothetical protein